MHSAYFSGETGLQKADDRRLENIWAAISLAAVDKMEQAFAAETKRGPSAIAAIMQIGADPGLSIERLRQIIALSHSATVRLLDQLAADDLIRREASAGADRRARALYLTERGKQLFDAAKAARRQIAVAALERLSAQERTQLTTIVEKMFPALVTADGIDGEVVCRFCDDKACPPERCPVPQHHLP
jgi:MarR family transcriptional regulator, negative regulator of the multidrug operon emrRAB